MTTAAAPAIDDLVCARLKRPLLPTSVAQAAGLGRWVSLSYCLPLSTQPRHLVANFSLPDADGQLLDLWPSNLAGVQKFFPFAISKKNGLDLGCYETQQPAGMPAGPHLAHPTEDGWELPQNPVSGPYDKDDQAAMTSLAVSLSVDSRGPCALYMLTDSRITWGKPADRWDGGRKTFCSKRFPDLFGYCGDAYFPPMMLSQIVEQLDAGLFCADNAPAEKRHEIFVSAMKSAIDRVSGRPPKVDFTIYHGARTDSGMNSRFSLWETRYLHSTGEWRDTPRDIEAAHSYLARVDGSGAASIEQQNGKWQATSAAKTSRSLVWAFFDSLRSKSDRFSGGPPQMVGIWRIGAGRQLGLIWNGWPYVAGLRAIGDLSTSDVQWFDESFEPCDAQGIRLKPYKEHARPDTNL